MKGRVIALKPGHLYDLAGAAELLGVSEATLRAWVDAGAVPVWQPGGEGGALFFSADALLRCVAEESVRRKRAPARKASPAQAPDAAPLVRLGEGRRKRTT